MSKAKSLGHHGLMIGRQGPLLMDCILCRLTPVRTAVMKKARQQALVRVWGKRPSPAGRREDGSGYYGSSSKTLKMGLLTTGSDSSPSEYIPKGNESRNSAGCLHPHFHCGTVDRYQDTDTTQMPISR